MKTRDTSNVTFKSAVGVARCFQVPSERIPVPLSVRLSCVPLSWLTVLRPKGIIGSHQAWSKSTQVVLHQYAMTDPQRCCLTRKSEKKNRMGSRYLSMVLEVKVVFGALGGQKTSSAWSWTLRLGNNQWLIQVAPSLARLWHHGKSSLTNDIHLDPT